ncbi:MAG: ADP-ribosylglycohydrolase family protein [Bacteroidota bacterium]
MKHIALIMLLSMIDTQHTNDFSSNAAFDEKVAGLIFGSLYGDALGGPTEFAVDPLRTPEVLNRSKLGSEGIAKLRQWLYLRPYSIDAAPYGPWTDQAHAGTTTDDSRMKSIFFQSRAWEDSMPSEALAISFLTYGQSFRGRQASLNQQWLKEFRYAAKWHLGLEGGLPPDRMWGGKPSMAGQMSLLPLAAIRPYELEWTYTSAWEMDFFDTGMARDFQAAIVVGLARALQAGSQWSDVEKAMREIDPYGYGTADFSQRKVNTWLDFAHEAVGKADGRPAVLFEILERELQAETWWECWIPLVVSVCCLEMVDHDPIAALELARQFGHDTDSYLQLLGAFVGAMHGVGIFPPEQLQQVKDRFHADYGECVEDWPRMLRKRKSQYPHKMITN